MIDTYVCMYIHLSIHTLAALIGIGLALFLPSSLSPSLFFLTGVYVSACMCVSVCFECMLCVYECMGVYAHGWVYGCMGIRVYGCIGVWVYGCTGIWVYGCVHSSLWRCWLRAGNRWRARQRLRLCCMLVAVNVLAYARAHSLTRCCVYLTVTTVPLLHPPSLCARPSVTNPQWSGERL